MQSIFKHCVNYKGEPITHAYRKWENPGWPQAFLWNSTVSCGFLALSANVCCCDETLEEEGWWFQLQQLLSVDRWFLQLWTCCCCCSCCLSPWVTLLLSCKSLHRCYLRLYVWLQDGGHAQRVSGQRSNGSCVCEVNSGTWSFPVGKFEAVLQQVHSCEGTLNNLQKKVKTLSASVFIPFTERVNHQVFLMHRSS